MIKFTLWGLYQYDPTLFNNAPVPDGIDKQMLIDTIMDNAGDLFCYYQQPERYKLAITNWFRRHQFGFSRMLEALNKEYDPLENYDRIEDETTTPNITRARALGGVDTNTASGRDTVTTDMADVTENIGKVSAFDSNTFENREHTDNITNTDGTVDTDYGRTDTTTYGRTDTEHETGNTARQLRAHGNIGVTTSQEMLRAELEVRKYDLYKTIAQMFEDDLLIQLY